MLTAIAVMIVITVLAWNYCIKLASEGLLESIEKLIHWARSAREDRAEEVATATWVKEGAHIF